MFQETLFTAVIEPVAHQTALSKAERIKKMQDAQKNEKNKACVEAFRPFLITFNQTHSLFIMADVVKAYRENNLPLPGSDFRCVGGCVNSLIKEGILIDTGEKRFLTDGTNRSMAIYKGNA